MAWFGVLGFIVALLVSVTLHEAGHFFTARHFGMKASRFFVGFGPTLWSFRRGETEYGVKAIPAGGFVKIEGMTPLDEVAPGDEQRAFWRFPARQRAVVLVAGSFMHFVIAILLVFGYMLAIGTPETNAPVVGEVSKCVVATLDSSCSDASATTPAPAANVLKPKDRVLAVNGQAVSTWTEVARGIRASDGKPLTMTLRRDGQTMDVTLTPVNAKRPSLDDPKKIEAVGAIGVTGGFAFRHLGPLSAVRETGNTLGSMVTGTVTVFTSKAKSLNAIYSPHRDPQGFVGVVGISRVSGDILAAPSQSVGTRIWDFLLLVAGVNLFVGIFNLLPLLPLDGGHLAIAGFEEGRHRIRRMFGYRGALRRVDLNKLMPITYAFVVLMVGLTLYIAGADILNPIRLNQ
jgi:membrane-associated protease RseP (regulator of RpoE activity)